MSTIRFAIWAAVSTEAQAAEDKVSLHEQETRCRAAALAKGWVETAGPYIVPGESRTRWVNLSDAEQAIPQLRAMLNDAQARRFDILVLYDYNRLRDLLDPVARALAFYGVQIYSISQPVEPQPPETFNPYTADSAWMMQGLAQIISRAQIADLRRKYAYAMPRRVTDKGIPASAIPFGYRKPPGRERDPDAIPEPDPVRTQLILELKDLLLQGYSLRQLAEHAQQSGIAPPRGAKRWYPQTIKHILTNPFYAGFVRWGLSRVRLDPRTGKRIRDRHIPANQTIIAPGRHQPLWDEATYRDILRELERRHINYKGKKNHALTGLLRCGLCEAPMWQFQNGPRSEPERRIWRCSIHKTRHVGLPYTEANRLVAQALHQLVYANAEELADLLQRDRAQRPDPTERLARLLDELKAQRRRLEDAYQYGALSLESFLQRTRTIDQQAERYRRQLEEAQQRQRNLETRIQLIQRFRTVEPDKLADLLTHGDQLLLNRILHTIFEAIIVEPDHTLRLRFAP